MNGFRARATVWAGVLGALLCSADAALVAADFSQDSGRASFVIRDVRIFDGLGIIECGSVFVQAGRIVDVGRDLTIPAGARVIEGEGMTLLPGLIDAHVHYVAPRNLAQSLAFGVTSAIDMGSDPALAAEARRRQARAGWTQETDLFTAGSLITAPGGHGTEYGLQLTTISEPRQADALVRERIRSGSDFIKLVLDSGRTYHPLPTISDASLRAVIAAGRRQDRRVIAHIGSAEEAVRAIDAGADGLAHLFVDAPPPPNLARLARSNGAFVIPTLAVMEKVVDSFDRSSLLGDERLRPYMSPTDIAALRRTFPVRAAVPVRMEHAQETVRRMRDAGVPLLAGSDSAITHGALLHRELELLVEAGLTPGQALTAATFNPAAQFNLGDRGAIRPGLRADLLLVRGDPTRDIRALRNIQQVWKRGRPVDRERFASSLAPEWAADERLRSAPPPPGSESGLVSDFDDGTNAARFGAGWSASTDQVAGGASVADLQVVRGGAVGSLHALQVSGEIRPGFAFGFAGALFSPGPRPYAPANLAGRTLSFWARGDGRTYGVLVSARSYASYPARRPFVATPEWTRYSFPLSAFDGMEGHDITAILFGAGPGLGTFSFQLDDVRIE